jgi:hypothetical protein
VGLTHSSGWSVILGARLALVATNLSRLNALASLLVCHAEVCVALLLGHARWHGTDAPTPAATRHVAAQVEMKFNFLKALHHIIASSAETIRALNTCVANINLHHPAMTSSPPGDTPTTPRFWLDARL